MFVSDQRGGATLPYLVGIEGHKAIEDHFVKTVAEHPEGFVVPRVRKVGFHLSPSHQSDHGHRSPYFRSTMGVRPRTGTVHLGCPCTRFSGQWASGAPQGMSRGTKDSPHCGFPFQLVPFGPNHAVHPIDRLSPSGYLKV